MDGHDFGHAIDVLSEAGVIGGYEDGSFRPDTLINRAEFVKILVMMSGLEAAGSDCFTDVAEEWFAASVCAAKEAGWINGYDDGSFGPANSIVLIEALKIVVNAFEVELNDPVGEEWYSAPLETMALRQAIPTSLNHYTEQLTRGEAVEIVWRTAYDVQMEPATALDEFEGASCSEFQPETYDNIDLDRVRDTWFEWTNDARAAQGLDPYVHDTQLDRTGTIWAAYSRDRGYIDHKRPGTSAYYDYYAIQSWFKNLGLTFKNLGGYTFVENIGRGPYSCSAEDCTEEVIDMMKYTFDYFMSEAGLAYRPHYNSIMSSYYAHIGFGIVVTDSEYYLTVHYATEIISDPAPFCD